MSPMVCNPRSIDMSPTSCTHGVYRHVPTACAPQLASGFRYEPVRKFLADFDLRSLKTCADEAFAKIAANVHQDWQSMMPTWKTKGAARGLLAWGETRGPHDKKGEKKVVKIIQKSNCIPELCRAPFMKGMDSYMDKVGVIPVESGR